MTLRGENPLTEKQTARARDFRQLLSGIQSIHYRDAARRLDVTIDKAEDVTQILKSLSWVEVPIQPLKRSKGDRVIELTTAGGKKVRLTYFKEPEKSPLDAAVPPGGDLVEVSGFGPIWLDGQWKYRFQQHVEALWFKARQERAVETTRRVAADLPAFLRQVRNVEIIAESADSKELTRELLTVQASRPVLEALKVERVEKLDWTPAKWRQTLEKKANAHALILTPGLGFSLQLIVSGDREMLIPGYGRVTFNSSPLEAIRKAAGGGGKDSSLVHPRGKEPGEE